MTQSPFSPPPAGFVAVAADTANWLAEQLLACEARGLSRPGSADRFRQRAQVRHRLAGIATR
jgi:hypothetical protein